MSSFGDWLRSARLAKGFSTTDLADAAGVTQPLITAYENGKRNPKRDTVEKIAKALSGEGDSYSRVLENALAEAGFLPPTQEITRAITDEEWALIESYRGNRPEQRELYQRLMANSVEVRGKEPNPEDVPLTE